MAIAKVQEVTASSGTGTTQYTMTFGTPISGNELYLMQGGSKTITVSSIAQTNVVWSVVKTSATNLGIELWRGVVSASPGTVATVTMSANIPSIIRAIGAEFSGIDSATGPLTAQCLANNGSSTTPTTGSATPTASGLFLLIGGGRGNNYVSGPTGGFTAFTSPNTGLWWGWQIVTSASGSYTAGWTITPTGTWDTVIGTFPGTVVAGSGWGPLLGLQNNRLVAA